MLGSLVLRNLQGIARQGYAFPGQSMLILVPYRQEDIDKKPYLVVVLAVLMILDDTVLESGSGDYDSVYDETAVYGINATYFFNAYCSLVFGMDYSESTYSQEGAGSTVEEGEVQQTPVYFTVRGHWPNESMAKPYVGIGMGYCFNDLDISATLNPGYSLDLQGDLGFHAVGGMETFITENFDVDVGLKLPIAMLIWSTATPPALR